MAELATGTSPTTSDNIGDVLASIRRLIAQDEANRSVTDPGQRLRQVAQQQAELRRATEAAAAAQTPSTAQAPLILGDHEMVPARPPFRQPALSMPRMRPVSDEQIFSDQAIGGPIPLRPNAPSAPSPVRAPQAASSGGGAFAGPSSGADHSGSAAPLQAPVMPPASPPASINAPGFLQRPPPSEPFVPAASAAPAPEALQQPAPQQTAPPNSEPALSGSVIQADPLQDAAEAKPLSQNALPQDLLRQDLLAQDLLAQDDLHLFAMPDEESPTEALLRNLIREAIRGELQGELGGQFSRNLRRVIRSEIELALRQMRRAP